MDEFLEMRFEHAAAEGVDLRTARLAIDTGDGLYTQAVYRWCRKHRTGGVVMPVKGVASFDRSNPVDGPTYVEVTVGGRKLKRGVGLHKAR